MSDDPFDAEVAAAIDADAAPAAGAAPEQAGEATAVSEDVSAKAARVKLELLQLARFGVLLKIPDEHRETVRPLVEQLSIDHVQLFDRVLTGAFEKGFQAARGKPGTPSSTAGTSRVKRALARRRGK